MYIIGVCCTGFVLGGGAVGKKGEKEAKDKLSLKWSTPKTSSLELQPCTSAYRVSPTNVSTPFSSSGEVVFADGKSSLLKSDPEI